MNMKYNCKLLCYKNSELTIKGEKIVVDLHIWLRFVLKSCHTSLDLKKQRLGSRASTTCKPWETCF